MSNGSKTGRPGSGNIKTNKADRLERSGGRHLSNAEAAPPLSGIRVLDFTRVIAGPYLTMNLSDMGCEVIKIEAPEHGDDTRIHQPPGKNGESANFVALNRNKRSVVLDFAKPEARQIAIDLARSSDVLVEHFRPGAMQRLGLSYGALREINPRLIYASISGYGYASRFRDNAGYDPIAQAEAGLMYMTGHPENPPVRAGGSVVDALAGMHAGMGVLSALYHRERTGKGQFVDVALYDTVLSTLGFVMQGPLLTGRNPPRTGNTSFFMAPNGIYACADGDVMISVGNNRLFRRLCQLLDLAGLPDDPRFVTNADRVANVDALNAALQARLGEQSRDHWITKLRDGNVPIGGVRTPLEALASAETEASGMLHSVQHPRIGAMRTVGSAIRLSDTPARTPGPAPLLGEHTERVLQDVLGLTPASLSQLRAAGVFGPERPAFPASGE